MPEDIVIMFQLRKEPISVSDIEAEEVFNLRMDEIEISGTKYPIWRPLGYIHHDFRDNNDGTIIDYATGLMWQKSGSNKWLPYDKAKIYLEDINCKKFASYKDWRLPTVDELKSLLTQEKQSNDLHISPIFDKTQSWCWTSDKHVFGGAWFVHFYNNNVSWYNLYDGYYVRAVRSIQ